MVRKVKSQMIVELDKPSKEIAIFELKKNVTAREIENLVKRGRNCIFTRKRRKNYVICGK